MMAQNPAESPSAHTTNNNNTSATVEMFESASTK
jgi:hypothetical protein